MNALRANRYTLTAITVSAFLVGCSGTQNALNLAPSSVTPNAAHAQHSKSWMNQGSGGDTLVYAPNECGGTCVLSYPDLKEVGALNAGAAAICSDTQGNIFLSLRNQVTEYAHGGTAPVATLSLPKDSEDEAWGCSVDPTTNNLAVVYGGGAVAIFPNESGTAKKYASKVAASFCGYDNVGNLFVSGYDGQNHAISELAKGQKKFTILSVKGKLGNPGQMQWDGSEMTYQDKTDGSPVSIAQLSISNYTVTVVAKTPLNGQMNYAGQSWIYNGAVLLPYGKKDNNINKLSVFPYPKGGKPTATFKVPSAYGHSFSSVTISVAPTQSRIRK